MIRVIIVAFCEEFTLNLSPRGRLRTQLLKGPIDFSYILFLWLGNVFWVFKLRLIIGLFGFSKKLYCDGWMGGWVDGWVDGL